MPERVVEAVEFVKRRKAPVDKPGERLVPAGLPTLDKPLSKAPSWP
jgi:hypothetical protein